MNRWLVLMLAAGLFMAGCGDKAVESSDPAPDPGPGYMTAAAVVDTLLHALNFQENGMTADQAVALYSSCLTPVDDSSGGFEYQVLDVLDSNRSLFVCNIDEELECITSLFSNIKSRDLAFTVSFREAAPADTELVTGMETFSFRCRIDMDHPISGSFPFLVEGEWILEVIKAENGTYTLSKWYDFIDFVSDKSAKPVQQAVIGTSSGWNEIKQLFRN